MNKRKIWFYSLGALLVIVIIIGIFFLNYTEKEDKIKLGAILPLTGSAATVGEFQKNGIEIAISEINEMGGISGKKVEVVFGDSKNEGREGISVLRKMMDIDKVKIFLASQSGVVVPVATQIASHEDALLFVTISSVPGLTKLGDNIFRFFVTSENESRKMAEFTNDNLKVKNVGVFYINDDFGLGGLNTFKESFKSYGGNIVWENSYEKTGSDFRTILQKAASIRNLEALYIIGYDRAFAIAVRQAREAGIKVPILSSIGMSVPEWINIAGASAEGVYVTATKFEPASNDSGIKAFVEKYNSQFGKDPNVLAAFTYDSFKLIIEAFSNGANTPQELAEKLKLIKKYEGTIGNVNFDESREANIDLIIRKVVDGKPVFYSY
jgi:branched-chain amino acid transport system substrate-binding protein